MKKPLLLAAMLSALPFYAYGWQTHQIELKNLTNHPINYELCAPSWSIALTSGGYTGSISAGDTHIIEFKGCDSSGSNCAQVPAGAKQCKDSPNHMMQSKPVGQGLIWYHLNFSDSSGDVLSGGMMNSHDSVDMFYELDGNSHGHLSAQNISIRDIRLPTDFVDLAVSPGGAVNINGKDNKPKQIQTSPKNYQIMDVGVNQILPYGQDCSTSTSVPNWACAGSAGHYTKTNGIYRIHFAYDIKADDLSQHPPVIGPFEIQNNKGQVIANLDRDYGFMYRVSSQEVKLEETFTYVVPYNGQSVENNPGTKIWIQGGYDDASGVFHKLGGGFGQYLYKEPDDGSRKLKDSGLVVSAIYDNDRQNSMTENLQNEALYVNGLNQAHVTPVICTNGPTAKDMQGGQSDGCPSGMSYIDPSVASDPSHILYQHMVYVDETNTNAKVVSNLKAVPNVALPTSSLFETGYIRSRYYCDPKTVFANDGACDPNGLSIGTKMTSYPPIAQKDLPSVPDYISLRSDARSQQTTRQLDVCYVYYNGQVQSMCLSNSQSGGPGTAVEFSTTSSELKTDLFTLNKMDSDTRQVEITTAQNDAHSEVIPLNKLLDPFSDLGGAVMINNQQETLVNGWATNSTINCQDQNTAMCYAAEIQHHHLDSFNFNALTPYASRFCDNTTPGTDSVHAVSFIKYNITGKYTSCDDTSCHNHKKTDIDKMLTHTQQINMSWDGGISTGQIEEEKSNNNDKLCVLSGWPLWGEWLTDNYPDRTDSTSYGTILYQQPFLYYKDTKQSYTASDEHDTYS